MSFLGQPGARGPFAQALAGGGDSSVRLLPFHGLMPIVVRRWRSYIAMLYRYPADQQLPPAVIWVLISVLAVPPIGWLVFFVLWLRTGFLRGIW
jgi:hypothetical protein